MDLHDKSGLEPVCQILDTARLELDWTLAFNARQAAQPGFVSIDVPIPRDELARAMLGYIETRLGKPIGDATQKDVRSTRYRLALYDLNQAIGARFSIP